MKARSSRDMPTCYMCSKKATSREHVPPRCIFPDSEDTSTSVNHRKKLITVPSCDEHNNKKSRDDEYLLFVLAGSYTSNDVGLTQFVTKVKRAFEHRPSKASEFTKKSAPISLRRLDQCEWEEGLEVFVDGSRIDDVLSNCARALYFHETGKKFLGPTQVMTHFTLHHDKSTQERVSHGFQATEQFFISIAPQGENRAVFWYKFLESPSTAIFLFHFYEHSEAIVRFKKILVKS